MSALNKELSSRVSNMSHQSERLLRPLLYNLASASTDAEESMAKEEFKKQLYDFVVNESKGEFNEAN